MTALQVLKKVRAQVRRGWTQGALARSKSGRSVDPDSPRACRYCLMGALYKVCPVDSDARAAFVDAVIPLVSKRGFSSYVAFNDDTRTRKKDVLSVLSEAIAKQKNA